MEQTQTQKGHDGQYVVKTKILESWGLVFVELVNKLLNFFSLKKTKRFWGVVYDSVSKQPLDPVMVKLLYSDGREIETGVTDMAGRYGFLASPGKFKIFVRKTNYQFPSKYALGGRDGIYENIYHGEFFTLYEDSEVLAPNIPMDPVNFDWNQQAKQAMAKTYPYWKFLFKRLVAVGFWFLLIFSLLNLLRFYPNIPTYLYLILVVYLILIFSAKLVPEPRLWGRIQIQTQNLKASSLMLELHSPQFPAVVFGRTQPHEDGKFLLRANQGKYFLTISEQIAEKEKILLGSMAVRIGSAGVLADTVEIKQSL